MPESANAVARQVLEIVATYGLNILGAVLILIVGWFAAGWIARITRNAARRTR